MSRTVTQTVGATAAVAPSSLAQSPSPAEPPKDKHGKVMTHILIDDYWYDLTYWKNSHPGGALILEQMNGNDATDAFYSLHSPEACDRLARLSRSKQLPAHLAGPPPPTKATVSFREFRAQLAKDGFFDRSLFWDLFYTLHVFAFMIVGSLLVWNGCPVWGTIALGFGMQQGGWVGHDYIHARNLACYINGFVVGAVVNAFSRDWWSNKHNTHHVYTNHIGIDVDIENDPIFHLFFPEEEKDTFFRKMQHWYFVPVASLLFYSWRLQSFQVALAKRNYLELALMAVNYAWLYSLGLWVTLASIYLAGALVALIVTVTHQSEEMITPLYHEPAGPAAAEALAAVIPDRSVPAAYSFVEDQFATTRDALTPDFFTHWLWGGMQYQLEHHLFPIMPKYYYKQVAPKVKAWAEKNGLEYKAESQKDILIRNFNTLKFYAQDKPATDKKKQ